MSVKVKAHKSKRGNRSVMIREYVKRPKYRKVHSSFIDKIKERPEGGYFVTIHGKNYPYPYLPDPMVGGLVRGHGAYYNHKIRSRYF